MQYVCLCIAGVFNSVTRCDEIVKVLGHFLTVDLVFGKLLNLLWEICYDFVQMLHCCKYRTDNLSIWTHWSLTGAQKIDRFCRWQLSCQLPCLVLSKNVKTKTMMMICDWRSSLNVILYVRSRGWKATSYVLAQAPWVLIANRAPDKVQSESLSR